MKVVVGYTGGKELNPTYKKMKDATESYLIEYDPTIISYEQILKKVRTTLFLSSQYTHMFYTNSYLFLYIFYMYLSFTLTFHHVSMPCIRSMWFNTKINCTNQIPIVNIDQLFLCLMKNNERLRNGS